jgi:hypothetical protein
MREIKCVQRRITDEKHMFVAINDANGDVLYRDTHSFDKKMSSLFLEGTGRHNYRVRPVVVKTIREVWLLSESEGD